MRMLPIWAVSSFFVGSAAFAFDCYYPTLPWDVVVCSDLGLQALADQRAIAFEEAKTRLTLEQIQHLRDDQKAWVHIYSNACGIRPDRTPPLPIPNEIIACFQRAGEARLTFLRSYASALRTSGNEFQSSHADNATSTVVRMELTKGIYVVPVRINRELTLRFVVDSGASDVSIPADVALTLIRTGTVRDNDFIGDQRYRMADGSTIRSARFILRNLQVGDNIIEDVPASVTPVESVPLLGQSFLSHFTSWTLDNERHALLLGPKRGTEPLKSLAQSPPPDIDFKPDQREPENKIATLMQENRWIIVGSPAGLTDAIAIARKFKARFPDTMVVKSVSGYYGIVIGQFDTSTLSAMINEGRIPKDSYATLGKHFLNIAWP